MPGTVSMRSDGDIFGHERRDQSRCGGCNGSKNRDLVATCRKCDEAQQGEGVDQNLGAFLSREVPLREAFGTELEEQIGRSGRFRLPRPLQTHAKSRPKPRS